MLVKVIQNNMQLIVLCSPRVCVGFLLLSKSMQVDELAVSIAISSGSTATLTSIKCLLMMNEFLFYPKDTIFQIFYLKSNNMLHKHLGILTQN